MKKHTLLALVSVCTTLFVWLLFDLLVLVLRLEMDIAAILFIDLVVKSYALWLMFSFNNEKFKFICSPCVKLMGRANCWQNFFSFEDIMNIENMGMDLTTLEPPSPAGKDEEKGHRQAIEKDEGEDGGKEELEASTPSKRDRTYTKTSSFSVGGTPRKLGNSTAKEKVAE